MVQGNSAGWWLDRVAEDGTAAPGFEWAAEWKTALAKLNTSTTGSADSVDSYHTIANLAVENVPYIMYGWAITVGYSQPDFEGNYDGVVAYYWNSYFTK